MTNIGYADFGDTILKKDIKNKDVIILKQKLNELGYFNNNEFTDLYDFNTFVAVKNLQEDCNIKADGIVGKDTIKCIDTKLQQLQIIKNYSEIKLNDTGDRVTDIQQKLKSLGLFSFEPNSKYDITTETAIIQFQTKYGLKPTGIVDGLTYQKMCNQIDKQISDRSAAERKAKISNLVKFAKSFLNVPYKWGASSDKSFDCSGFTMYVFNKYGVSLDHSASSQLKNGKNIKKSELQLGDLVFFSTYKKGASHVGIYLGDNKFIHASSGVNHVTITDLNTDYYEKRYVGAARYDIK